MSVANKRDVSLDMEETTRIRFAEVASALEPMKTMKTRLLLALVGSTIGFVSQIFPQRTVDPKIDQQIADLSFPPRECSL